MTTARSLVQRLGAHRIGGGWQAACPVCQPERRREQRALSISTGADGRLLAYCHKTGCDWRAILYAAGLEPGERVAPRAPRPAPARPDHRDQERIERARALWRAALPGAGTLVERYLAGRGIAWPAGLRVRFLPSARRPDGTRGPAMLVAAKAGGEVVGIQATFLDARGERLRDERGKTLRRSYGRLAGAFCRLLPGDRPVVGEGVETALAALQRLRRAAERAAGPRPADGEGTGPEHVDAWQEWTGRARALAPSGAIAGLGTATLARIEPESLRWLGRLPERVILAADGDEAGRHAATEAAGRLRAAGIEVELAAAPHGHDAADMGGVR